MVNCLPHLASTSREGFPLTQPTDRYADAEAITWMEHAAREHIATQEIKVADFDDDAQAKYDEMQPRLDNVKLQCADIPQSCRELNIQLDTEQDIIYQVEGMTHGQSLRFWQVPAVARIMRIFEARSLRACVLADGSRLGEDIHGNRSDARGKLQTPLAAELQHLTWLF